MSARTAPTSEVHSLVQRFTSIRLKFDINEFRGGDYLQLYVYAAIVNNSIGRVRMRNFANPFINTPINKNF
jgi:hypothetical protein